LVLRTFGDQKEAFVAWQEICIAAITEPFEYVEPNHPRLRHIDFERQAAIDNAAYEDKATVTS